MSTDVTAGSKLKQIREIGMKVALDHEKKQGRTPKDVSNQKALGYDIVSGERRIEVKGQECAWKELKTQSIYLTENELRNATHLYIVCDARASAKPDLHIFELSKIPLTAVTVEIKHRLSMSCARDYET